MKPRQLTITGILVISGAILVYSNVNFELAEQYFENERNGLICNKPGSNCPYPDFEDPMYYGVAGLAVFFSGMILAISQDKSGMTRKILGMVAIFAGVFAFASGVLAYLDDYQHFLSVMKNCSNVPCMYPMVFANVQFAQFYGIYGAILVAIGMVLLVRKRIMP
jgi:hypothetical protein